jgi:CheY-like chemotaxis protein
VPEVVDLNEVVRSMTKMIRRLVREDIFVDLRLPSCAFHIFVDKSQLEQVIMNLVVNARDAMPDGGELVIETMRSDADENDRPQVVLSVRDTGFGMDEETLGRIFEPFFTTKEQGKGTGLGLATVYGIVHQSGGNIFVDSTPGKGTAFNVYLPYAEGVPSDATTIIPDSTNLTGEETVLVVEDENALLSVVARILRRYGYTVLTAPHSGDALILCERRGKPIDLLLVDVVLPRMNGSELAGRLKRIHPEMEVLYMSGYSDFTVVRQVMVENVDRFIAKPFSAKDLLLKVREVLGRRET